MPYANVRTRSVYCRSAGTPASSMEGTREAGCVMGAVTRRGGMGPGRSHVLHLHLHLSR